MWGAVLFLVALLIVKISHWWYTWANPKSHGKLPPGSMGFPIIGETFEFLSNSLYDIPPFISKRMQRYGPMFRTNLFGKHILISTDPEINYNIFQEENESFVLFYPETFMKVFGEGSGLLVNNRSVHKYFKNLIIRGFSPDKLKAKLLPGIDKTTRKHLDTWASFGNIDVKEGSSKMMFEYFAKILFGYEEALAPNGNLRNNFQVFMDGLYTFPLNLPGTAYHACLQGGKNVRKVIENAFEKRKVLKTPCNDFLDHLLEEMECEDTFLDKQSVISLIFGLLFASHESTSSTSTFAIKFISNHPDVLEELTKEHEAILKARRNSDESGLTWEEYKSITFTHMVVNETVRLANIVTGTFRKVVKDVEMKGYTIPAGWMVMVVTAAVNLSTDKYENPLQFNPWRWEGQELHIGSKTFMAFGGGIRLCPGADFAKLQMAILIHHMVTKYRWFVIKGGNVLRKPTGVTFPDGLHIEISEKQKR